MYNLIHKKQTYSKNSASEFVIFITSSSIKSFKYRVKELPDVFEYE